MSFHLRAYVRGFFLVFFFRGTLGPAFLQQECLLEVFTADSCFIRARMLQRAKVLRGGRRETSLRSETLDVVGVKS